AFTSAITGLSQATPYHVRAFATNNQGTAYGQDRQFTTLSSDSGIIYVDGEYGFCNGYTPCFSTVQDAVDFAVSGDTIWITDEYYGEDVVLDELKAVILEGGWNDTYSDQSSYTTINTLTIHQGLIIPYRILLGPLLIVDKGKGLIEFGHDKGMVGRFVHEAGLRIDPGPV
ncbi:MAG: hypothetical protein JRK53_01935, partial [Deltaproteobacteria bacterium]|nr:hypothetical protein [Deltaproteobacteria bacterium]